MEHTKELCPNADELVAVVREIFARGTVSGAITRPLSNGERYVIQPYSSLEAEHANLAQMRARLLPLAGIENPAAFVEAAREMAEALAFYADPDGDGYDVMVTDYGLSTQEGDIIRDRGEKAQAALASYSSAMGEKSHD